MKPWIVYFAKAHIRRQYENIHNSCNGEILSKNGSDAEIENLRKTANDLKNAYNSLPSRKKFFVSTGTLISVAAFPNSHGAAGKDRA